MTRLVYLFCNETFKMLNPNLQVKRLKNITFAELILIIWYFFHLSNLQLSLNQLCLSYGATFKMLHTKRV